MNARISCLIALLATVMLAVQAQAVVLTFSSPTTKNGGAGYWLGNQSINLPALNDAGPAAANSSTPLPIYGDHVSSFTEGSATSPNAYNYGTTYGLTPDIGIAYGPGDPTKNSNYQDPTTHDYTNGMPVWWGGGFGNLSGVMYQVDYPYNSSPTVDDLTMSITLTADPGFVVDLESFDLAAFSGDPNNLDSLEIIVDGTPHVIGTNLTIANTFAHTSFDFSAAPFKGSTVEIFMDGRDTTPYTNPAKGSAVQQAFTNFTDIGIDNIAFAESTPEPASMGLLACGSLLLLRRRRV